jgi:hypothetical protein
VPILSLTLDGTIARQMAGQLLKLFVGVMSFGVKAVFENV